MTVICDPSFIVMNRELFEALGLHKQFGEDQGVSFLLASANGRSTSEIEQSTQIAADANYHPCEEAFPVASVTAGSITRLRHWAGSAIFPQTSRDIAFYRPAGIADGQAVAVLVCFDGAQYLDEAGPVRATTVLDNLIASGAIPPTAAIFVDPGLPAPIVPEDLATPEFDDIKCRVADQRSLEYDSLDNHTSRFVIEELLPLAAKTINVRFDPDPEKHIVCGISSGGIAAFTVAWHRPDVFGVVISHCGSYVNLRGGHNYPYLVRTTPRKPIKVYLQTGEGDADITFGSWPLANRQMAAALAFAGYDYHFDFGVGGHTLRHAGAIFADTLRWCFGTAEVR